MKIKLDIGPNSHFLISDMGEGVKVKDDKSVRRKEGQKMAILGVTFSSRELWVSFYRYPCSYKANGSDSG